jgi:hypothetical protein
MFKNIITPAFLPEGDIWKLSGGIGDNSVNGDKL